MQDNTDKIKAPLNVFISFSFKKKQDKDAKFDLKAILRPIFVVMA